MQKITEEQIALMAPNPNAVANGRKISQKGGFVRLERSEDDTFYMGECKGSGKSNYLTSVDFIDPSAPVCRCSCPSRQFPCKHGIALLFEIAGQKSFSLCEIPEDIKKKREKKQNREKKAETGSADGNATPVETGEEQTANHDNGAKETKTKTTKTTKRASGSSRAKVKKLQKQLEGLELAEQMIKNIVKSGLGVMGADKIKTYEEVAKQLGNYYLPGPQHLVMELIFEIRSFQNDEKEEHYENAVKKLEKLWALVKKSKSYLEKKIETSNAEQEDTELYELLGGAWKLEELEALNLCRKDAELMQLSFWISYDEAGKTYVDTGCYADLKTGEIFCTYNYRPAKALKYMKQDDSVFQILQIPTMAVYPGACNQRVRWNGAGMREETDEDRRNVISFASSSIAQEAKRAKNLLKNALAPDFCLSLLSYDQIVKVGLTGQTSFVLMQGAETIVLDDMPGMEPTIYRMEALSDTSLLKNQVLFGAFFYEASEARLKFYPLSILTEKMTVRLLY